MYLMYGRYGFFCSLRARRIKLKVNYRCGHAVRRRSLTAEARVRSRASPCKMWWKNVTETGFLWRFRLYPCLCHSVSASEQCSFGYREALETIVPLPNNNQVRSIENLAVYEIRTRNNDVSQISIIIDCTSVAKICSVRYISNTCIVFLLKTGTDLNGLGQWCNECARQCYNLQTFPNKYNIKTGGTYSLQ
jgi:hypothetical protein